MHGRMSRFVDDEAACLKVAYVQMGLPFVFGALARPFCLAFESELPCYSHQDRDRRGYPLDDLRARVQAADERNLLNELWARVEQALGWRPSPRGPTASANRVSLRRNLMLSLLLAREGNRRPYFGMEPLP